MSIQVISPETEVAKTTEVSPDQTVVSNPSVSKKVSAQVASTQAPVKATAAAALAKKDEEEEARQAQIAEAAGEASEAVAEEQVAEATPAEVTETAKTIAEVSQEIDATAESLAALDAPMMFAQAGAAAGGAAAGGISTAAIVAGVAVVGVAAAASSSSTPATTPAAAAADAAAPAAAVTGTTYELRGLDQTTTGTANNDLFDGSTAASLNAGDIIDGLAGSDSLYGTDVGGSGAIDGAGAAPTISNVENIYIRALTNADTLQMDNVTGVTLLANDQSSQDLAFEDIQAYTTVLNVRGAGTSNTIFDFASVTGTNSAELKVSGTSGQVQIDGVETLTITGEDFLNLGPSLFSIAAVEGLRGTVISTINITSNSSTSQLNLGELTQEGVVDDDYGRDLVVNASAAGTGGVRLDLTDLAAADDLTFTGSAGNDEIVMTAGDISVNDTLSFGDGTLDTLTFADFQDTATPTLPTTGAVLGVSGVLKNVTGVERIGFAQGTDSAATGTKFDVSNNFGSINRFLIANTSTSANADSAEFNGLQSGVVIDIAAGRSLALLDFETFTGAGTKNGTLNLNGNLGANATTIADLDSAAMGTLTIDSGGSTGTNKITNAATVQAVNLVIKGARTLDLDDTALNTATVTVDANLMTGALSVLAGTSATAITGGSGSDTLTGNSAADQITGGAGDDTIQGAAGGDTMSGGEGADTIGFILHATDVDSMTGGAGNDTFSMQDGTAAASATARITDFTVGEDSLVLDISAVEDLLTLTRLETVNATVPVANDKAIFALVSADDTALTSTTANIVLLTGKTYANSAAALTDIGTGGVRTFTTTAAQTTDDGFIVAYELTTGGVAFAVAQQNGAVNTSSTIDGLDEFLLVLGATATTIQNANISFVA